MLQDRTGIVWIGTNGGLNRYDGALFIQYNLISKPALSSSVITALMEDEEGNIWVGTENGVNILNPTTNAVKQLTHDPKIVGSIPAGVVRSIQKMKDGSIWVMSKDWIVKYNKPGSFQSIPIDPALLGVTKVFAGISESDSDDLWIAYVDHPTRLSRINRRLNRIDSISATDFTWPDYSRVYIDTARAIWGISKDGVKLFNHSSGQYQPWLVNNATRSLSPLHLNTCFTVDASGSIWQGSQALNLVRYDLRKKELTDYNWLLTSCKATMVNCLYTDAGNTIWIGTDNGIIKLSNRTSFFRSIPIVLRQGELKDIRCRKIVEDKYHALYAGTENYGLLKLVPSARGGYTTIPLSTYGAFPVSSLPIINNCITIPAEGQYDIGYMYDMWYDGNNTIWLTGFGLLKYDIPTGKMEIFLAGKGQEENQKSITQFSICYGDSLIWTGGQQNLYTFNIATRQMDAFCDDKGGMPFAGIPCWSLAKTGEWIWVGTDKGLFRINGLTKEVIKETTFEELQLGINDIFIDGDKSIWISTAGGGILHYNYLKQELVQYTTRDGLSNNTICGALSDGDGNLWISTYAGLNFLNRQTNQFTSFFAKDGLNGNEFNRKAFGRLHNGDLIFGGLNGYNVFNANDAFIDSKVAELLLTSFSKTTAEGEVKEMVFGAGSTPEIEIGPGEKSITFIYTLTDMYDPGSNRYSYKLDGLDDEWHYIGNQHILSFMSLPAGKYTLRIKGVSAKYPVAKNELAIGIVVRQVFYKSAWFILIAILILAAIIWGIMRYQIRQLGKVQALRTRIASDLHDEVGGNLVRITMLADAGKRAGDTEKMYEQLGLIAGISRGAATTIKDVIWNIDSRNDSMTAMVGYMHEHIHNMLTPASIEFSFQHNGVSGEKKLEIGFRQNVYLIFKEAINNIVKHSGADYVDVVLEQKSGLFTMTIKDNGRGMPENGHSTGQGLYNMKMRAKRIKADLEIVSREGLVIIFKAKN